MEMEANKKECLSLESQLETLNKHIVDLTSELDSQRTKVHTKSDIKCSWKVLFLEGNRSGLLSFQVSSIIKSRDEVQAEHKLASRKIKECDSQISGIVKKQQDIQQKISEANLERKRMENEVIHM